MKDLETGLMLKPRTPSELPRKVLNEETQNLLKLNKNAKRAYCAATRIGKQAISIRLHNLRKIQKEGMRVRPKRIQQKL